MENNEEESIYDYDTNSGPKLNEKAESQKPLHEEESLNEKSIYEENSFNDISESSHSQALDAQNYAFSTTDKKLSFVGNDAEAIPTEMIYQFGLKTLILDVSFNCLSELDDLQQFPYLEELICDNNMISEKTHFPKLESLKIFSCNKNKIEDIHVFIDRIKISFPNLTYLSMLGNSACPNQLIDSSKDDYDYSRYRKYVLHRLRNLKFLDCYEVTKQERELVSNEKLFFDTVKLVDDNKAKSEYSDKSDDTTNRSYTSLPVKNYEELDENNLPQSSFGVCKYVYYGKQSEGNRFIRNDDL